MKQQMNQPDPPKWAMNFFLWFCREELSDAVLGDLLELYDRRHADLGKTKADWLFVWNVIQFLQPFALKRKSESTPSNHITMFRHYFKISWRNLRNQKMYSAIKIGGFSMGIALFLLIALFVRDELSMDRHYENGGDLYRILSTTSNPADSWTRGSCLPAPAAGVIREQIPNIEKIGRLISFDGWYLAGSNLFRPADEATNVYEERFAYADPEFIQMMEIPMVYGDRDLALKEPKSILISKRKAEKYFPGENPIGKTVILNDREEETYVIGGVMENLENTHLEDFDFFLTLSDVEFWKGEQADWCCWNYSPYVQLNPGTDPKSFEESLVPIYDNYVVGWLRDNGDQRADSIQKYGAMRLQAVEDIHLKSQDVSDFLVVGDMRIVGLFSAIGIFILLLACINFINLSTAKSANRAKEVGLRKVVGSHRSDLINQFLSESLIFCAISVVLGVLIAEFAMPSFNQIAGKEMGLPYAQWWFVPGLILLTLIIGLISGLYPSFYLSSFKPITVLRGSISRGSKGSTFRNGLVVFQFTTSIVLIVGAFIVYQQMQFILNKKLGFDKEMVINVQGTNTLKEQTPVFKEELLKIPSVEYASASSSLPVIGTMRNGNAWWKKGRKKIDESVGGQIWWVDEDYVKAMGMNLVEGRMFEHDRASDSAGVVINQKMAQELGLENPVGEQIENWRAWTIVGVVEDFHFDLMKEEIRPLVMVPGGWGDIISVKVKDQDIQETLTSIESTWDEFKPNQPFRYTFLDESYARMYDDVKRTGNIFTIFAMLAIIVACLGLFALSAFMVEQRSKEISVRKVLGASLSSIFNLLTVDFLKLVLIAMVISIPVGWYMMNNWLEAYAYRIEITWTVFAVAGVIAVLIALLTISSESLKAATANPADKLRSE